MPPRCKRNSRGPAPPRARPAQRDALGGRTAAAADLLKLLGNEHRLLILCALSARREMSVGELVGQSGISQSALSQHLARLREDGIVAFRRDAQMVYYRIADRRAARVLERLGDIYCQEAE